MTVSYYLAHWNVPMFPTGCTTDELEDKDVHHTMIRVNAAYDKLGTALLEIFNTFGWKRTVILNKEGGLCGFGSEIINYMFRDNNITVAEWIKIRNTMSISTVDEYLDRLNERGRSE